jgi:acyl-CoA:acyl-CoA alkyltransferase
MTSTVSRVGITAVAGHLPDHEVSTADLQERIALASGLPLPDGMFEQATGIERRRIAADDEYASDLAVGAARRVLAAADLDALDIDLLLFASATRDMVEPATAHVVQAALGSRAHALDVTNACNSFLNGIDLARSMILAGRARRALVVTGETPTRAMRPRLDGMVQARSTFLNRVRRTTTAIVHNRAMVVENSTRRLRAYGVVGTAKWYLDRGSGALTADPR